MCFVLYEGYGHHRALHVLTPSFPTRHSSHLLPFRHDCPCGAVTGPVAASGYHSLAGAMGGIDRQAWCAAFPSKCYEIRRGRGTERFAFIETPYRRGIAGSDVTSIMA